MFFLKKKEEPQSRTHYDWLVAGLGNPERKYLETRHNIGWMVVASFCEKRRSGQLEQKKLYFKGRLLSEKSNLLVILPTTYMNNSGIAVAAASRLYKIPPDRILVVTDEYNFPLGKVHVRSSGGDGGHNGLTSIIEHLGTNEFYRLRCGIGRNFGEGGLIDYVLSEFSPDEIHARDEMIRKAVASIEYLTGNIPGKAMSLINSGKLFGSAEDIEGENRNV